MPKKQKKRKEPERVGNDIYGVKSNLRLEQQVKSQSKDDITRSKYYHRYYHGYTEVRTESQSGKVHIDRIYTAPWVIQDVTRMNYVYYRIIYGILTAGVVGLFIYLMTSTYFSGTTSVFVAIPTFFAAIGLLLLCAATINYICMHKQMTWYDYHSASDGLEHASIYTAGALAVTALFVLIHIFFGVPSVGHELLLAAGILFCAGACLLIWYIEKEMPYKEIPNLTKLPPGEKFEIW